MLGGGLGRESPARELIRRGAEIDAKDGEGQTPLHHAALAGSEASLRDLLDAGADPGARDAQGRLPEDCAEDEASRGELKRAREAREEAEKLGRGVAPGGARAEPGKRGL